MASLLFFWRLESSLPNDSPVFILGNAVITSKAADSQFRSGENEHKSPLPSPLWWICLRWQPVGAWAPFPKLLLLPDLTMEFLAASLKVYVLTYIHQEFCLFF